MFKEELQIDLGLFLVLIGSIGLLFITIGIFMNLLWFNRIAFIILGFIIIVVAIMGIKKLKNIEFG